MDLVCIEVRGDEVLGEVVIIHGGAKRGRGVPENGHSGSVLGGVLWVGGAASCEFRLGGVEVDALFAEGSLDDVEGLWQKVGWNGSVEVIEIGGNSRLIVVGTGGSEGLELSVDFEEGGVYANCERYGT